MSFRELSLVSYNIHKGFSPFGRPYTLGSIKQHLEGLNPDLVFLQEVRGLCPRGEHANQMEHLADSLWPHTAYGKNAVYTSAHHGNAILSRFPMGPFENRNVSRNRFERRGILYANVPLPDEALNLHLFCLHLNLLERDRFRQSEDLLQFIEEKSGGGEPVLVAGDFNDWTGKLSAHLSEHLDSVDGPIMQNLSTYPSFLPVFRLDRIFSRNLQVLSLETLKSPEWVQLSDHLPLVARVALRL